MGHLPTKGLKIALLQGGPKVGASQCQTDYNLVSQCNSDIYNYNPRCLFTALQIVEDRKKAQAGKKFAKKAGFFSSC